jgi:hypothetical protein
MWWKSRGSDAPASSTLTAGHGPAGGDAQRDTEARYRYVVANQALAARIPCYCGCGKGEGHASLKDCFIAANGKRDEHAAGCDICLDIARDLELLAVQTTDVKAIRGRIDDLYREYGPATNTP